MKVSQKLKHIFRIYGQPSTWHVFVLLSMALAIGGYLGSGIKQSHHGWALALYALPGVALGIACAFVVASFDYLVLRNAYLHFDAKGNMKARNQMMTVSLVISFLWMFVAWGLGFMVGHFVISGL